MLQHDGADAVMLERNLQACSRPSLLPEGEGTSALRAIWVKLGLRTWSGGMRTTCPVGQCLVLAAGRSAPPWRD